jgi:SAM-dependent methyltransferase
MTSRDDLTRWDGVAAQYAATVGGEVDSFYRRFSPFLWDQLGDTNLAGKRVLDLGCGHGWLASILTDHGADVVGIDGSEALIKKARADYPGIEFEVHDLTEPLPKSIGLVDAVIAHMVLMDVPDIDQIMASVADVVPPGGLFLFTILHPSFFNQPVVAKGDDQWVREVTGYLAECQWTVTSFGGHTHYHRPLARYVQSAAAHNLVVTGLDEPPSLPIEPLPESEWDQYQKWFSSIPTMLSIACTKAL